MGESLRAAVGWVPVAALGSALVAPVPGARFDPADADDVALVLRLVTMWPRRLLRLGADVQAVDVERRRVRIARAPSCGDDVPIEWAQVASRVELARWARRAAFEAPAEPERPAVDGVNALAAALAPYPAQAARGRADVERVREAERVAGRPWPPPMEQTAGRRHESRTSHRPGLVLGGLTTLPGCVCGPGVPRVVAPAGAWRCLRCGAVTAIAEPVGGPRLPSCACLGEDVPVCAPGGRGGPRRASRGPATSWATMTGMGDPRATHARAAVSGSAEPRSTRARERRGRVVGDERHRLRGELGWLLYSKRSERSWTQARLAEEAGVTETTVRELERGQVRPSDAMTRKLGRALESGRGELAAAVSDLRLQRAAGASLRPLNRRRPPRLRTQRLYATAAALLDDEQARQTVGRSEFLDMITDAFADPDPLPGAPSPADAWPDRWPRIG